MTFERPRSPPAFSNSDRGQDVTGLLEFFQPGRVKLGQAGAATAQNTKLLFGSDSTLKRKMLPGLATTKPRSSELVAHNTLL